MARIPLVNRDAVDQKEQAAYDAFSASRGGEPKVESIQQVHQQAY